MRNRAGGLTGATRRLIADRRANFAVMTALCTPVALALTAFAIDEGSLYNERRAAQSIVDLAAITAAANINNAQKAVLTTLKDNGITSVAVQQQGTDIAPTGSKAKPAVTTLLNSVTAPVDGLVYNVLAALGVHVGEADVRVTGATCGRSVLVQ
ncbi:pilus assembly protein TadG-related protein [Mesorhizobium tamadayense]|nr:pilus assembly protein TadG-related protein [Mesorhizobium tamadayense]